MLWLYIEPKYLQNWCCRLAVLYYATHSFLNIVISMNSAIVFVVPLTTIVITRL